MKDGDMSLGGRNYGNGRPQSFNPQKVTRGETGFETSQQCEKVISRSGSLSFLYICILFVGLHSVFLGLFIYFFTDIFYKLFFSTQPENVFFVRQSGVFLFCLGSYYLMPFINFQKLHNTVVFTIFTKVVAVLFLVFNAHLSLSPTAIYLAAAGDASMALILLVAFLNQRRNEKGGRNGFI